MAKIESTMIGPKLPDQVEQESQAKAVDEVTDGQSDLEKKHISRLTETEDFVQFRENLRKLGQKTNAGLDGTETLRFIVQLCETLLTKSGNVEFEEITIVEQSLSIAFCLILSDLQLLQNAVLSQDIKLLKPDSTLKLDGYSDLVSFFMAGLLSKRNALFVKYFNNSFTILMRESDSRDVQNILLKCILEHILKGDISSRSISKYIELGCSLLESICAEDKDEKILLGKQDINTIINLETLFFKILDILLEPKSAEKEDGTEDDELIIGYFKILEKVLNIEPKIKQELSRRKERRYIERVLKECLFNMNQEPEAGFEHSIKCTNVSTRAATYDLLVELTKENIDNSFDLLENGLIDLCNNLPNISSWRYTPFKDKKSPQGFLGIFNMSSICYINSMLQQFYMTPAFRYLILAAEDAQEANIVEDKDGRKVDDNNFHQLQKMFAYLDKSERRDYHPIDFCYSFKDYSGNPVNVTVQQDTQEFLNIFFDKVENALKPTPYRNILNDVYGGKTISVIECSSCGHLRTNEAIFYNVSLEVKNLKNIHEGFEKFITEDLISDFKCENCKQKCDVMKRTLIKDCPNVMIVHLQRIVFDLDMLMNVKVNSRYEFPQAINLKPYTYAHYQQTTLQKEPIPQEGKEAEATETEPEGVKAEVEPKPAVMAEDDFAYTLAGVLVHRGSAEAGHYYSYINVNRKDPRRPKK
jgi:ubiquitin carboxyl-terminal hydrolase 34